MARTVGIGNQRFADIREHNDFYVDKTDFIREWWGYRDTITLIARPRRFGKTLNMSMLECFFSLKYAGRSDLFEGLSIWEDEYYRTIQGTYPVIFLSFASVKEQKDYKKAMYGINNAITYATRVHSYLLQDNCLSNQEKNELLAIEPSMSAQIAASSINNLCIWLERYHGKKPIILLDEYDTPMQEAWLGGYWDEMSGFYRSFFNATFKTNPALERALMTGITRISKESIFSDLNNLRVITTTSNKYETAFGFTEEEVKSSLEEMGLADTFEGVKAWYDGFTFGTHTDIYNPWSIINYLSERKLFPYWTNTSSNALVNQLIKTGDAQIKTSMEDLLGGGVVNTVIDEQVVFYQLDESPEAIWSLLLASGYLKVVAPPEDVASDDVNKHLYTLALTNKEVVRMFEDFIRAWFSGRDSRTFYNEFIKALIAYDVPAMNYFMNEVTKETFSYFDTSGNSSNTIQSERFYHGFVLGLLIQLKGRYLITSNRESGYGRYDVALEPLYQNDSAYIIEFKTCLPYGEKTVEDALNAAHNQMREKDYASALIARGIAPERIHELGFVFEGKRVLIG